MKTGSVQQCERCGKPSCVCFQDMPGYTLKTVNEWSPNPTVSSILELMHKQLDLVRDILSTPVIEEDEEKEE